MQGDTLERDGPVFILHRNAAAWQFRNVRAGDGYASPFNGFRDDQRGILGAWPLILRLDAGVVLFYSPDDAGQKHMVGQE